jgi:CheY-like chemotaxis protein
VAQGKVGASKKIVVVNDNAEFLRMMEQLLEDEGYRVIVVQGADGAQQVIRREMPDIAIIDVRMAGVVDWHVLTMVKLDPQTSDIPVVVCSAAVDAVKELEERLRYHNCEILLKPFNLTDLLDLLARLGTN